MTSQKKITLAIVLLVVIAVGSAFIKLYRQPLGPSMELPTATQAIPTLTTYPIEQVVQVVSTTEAAAIVRDWFALVSTPVAVTEEGVNQAHGDSELVTRLRLIGESYREREKTAKRATERLLCQLRADTCERSAAALAARQQDARAVLLGEHEVAHA